MAQAQLDARQVTTLVQSDEIYGAAWHNTISSCAADSFDANNDDATARVYSSDMTWIDHLNLHRMQQYSTFLATYRASSATCHEVRRKLFEMYDAQILVAIWMHEHRHPDTNDPIELQLAFTLNPTQGPVSVQHAQLMVKLYCGAAYFEDCDSLFIVEGIAEHEMLDKLAAFVYKKQVACGDDNDTLGDESS
jgi:hypothetical protein